MELYRINPTVLGKRAIAGKKETVLYIFMMLLIAVATYKYVAHGETYIFETPYTGEKIGLNDNLISQDIIVDEKAVWE